MPECSKCGRSFDSERGLHIHQSKVHDKKQQHEKSSKKFFEVKSLKPWVLACIVIIIGVTLLLSSQVINDKDTLDDGEEGENFNRELKIVLEGENKTEVEHKKGDNYSKG